jgi:predicted ester cyclase
MQGFDAEFRDLDHYIRVITDRIWEGRRIEDIRRYYSDDCAVETPSSVSVGVQPVIDGTRATLLAFPDRRLLAEDVIVSGDARGGYLSSHRIFSPMTHAGAGAFGPATGRPVHARTIADCVCINNRIVHEWLVRDQSAIARQTGQHERDVAQRWLNERGGFAKPPMPPAPAPYVSCIDSSPLAQAYASAYVSLWSSGDVQSLQSLWHERALVALPGGEVAIDTRGLQRFWVSVLGALACTQFVVEHVTAVPRHDHVTALALRWRAFTRHQGAGRYGAVSGKAVEVMGICHAELEQGRVVREWVLIDDVALWMQVLDVQAEDTSQAAARSQRPQSTRA